MLDDLFSALTSEEWMAFSPVRRLELAAIFNSIMFERKKMQFRDAHPELEGIEYKSELVRFMYGDKCAEMVR
jgi:hypothetical protein